MTEDPNTQETQEIGPLPTGLAPLEPRHGTCRGGLPAPTGPVKGMRTCTGWLAASTGLAPVEPRLVVQWGMEIGWSPRSARVELRTMLARTGLRIPAAFPGHGRISRSTGASTVGACPSMAARGKPGGGEGRRPSNRQAWWGCRESEVLGHLDSPDFLGCLGASDFLGHLGTWVFASVRLSS